MSICRDELISAPKIMTSFPTLPLGNENSERELNPIPEVAYMYLSRSAFLVRLIDPNKQLPNVKSVIKSLVY